jgi:Cystatin domain
MLFPSFFLLLGGTAISLTQLRLIKASDPSFRPTETPTGNPSETSSDYPTGTNIPPTNTETIGTNPTRRTKRTKAPSEPPTGIPSETSSDYPTNAPTNTETIGTNPTRRTKRTKAPSEPPTGIPSETSSDYPTNAPTNTETMTTNLPTRRTKRTKAPSEPPTGIPSETSNSLVILQTETPTGTPVIPTGPGSWFKIPLNSTEVLLIAELVITETYGDTFDLFKITNAQSQIVAGTNYNLTIDTLLNSNECVSDNFVVYDRFGNISTTSITPNPAGCLTTPNE